jgi:hypothetical protein
LKGIETGHGRRAGVGDHPPNGTAQGHGSYEDYPLQLTGVR